VSRPRRLKHTGDPVRRVALVYSPIRSGIPLLDAMEQAQKRPGLGLRYLKAVLGDHGVAVDLFDNLYDSKRAARVHEQLNQGRYDLVGFHTTSASRAHALATVARLDPTLYAGRVLLGGPGVLHADELLERGFDVAVRGEGEETILRLIEAYEGRGAFEEIPGISYDDLRGERHDTGESPFVDVSRLPFPNWDDVDADYGDMLNVTLRRPFFVMMGSRGCPYRCAFCASHQHWRQGYRARPVAHVLDEMSWLVEERGARYIHFLDDVFGMQPGWVDAFCDGLESRRLRVDFSIVLHPHSFKAERRRLLTRLQRVGCRLVSVGAQSSSPEVLRAVRRAASEPDGIRALVSISRELGMASVLTFIFGLPGDTRETVLGTIDFACEVRPTLVDFHPLLYLPGSEIADVMPPERYSRLSDVALNRLCLQASLRFYVREGGLVRLGAWTLRHNPRWFTNLRPVGRLAGTYLMLRFDRRGTKTYL
jgi:anaerobic magnesium-protoporphyrin IX monomethyl ester cyclase